MSVRSLLDELLSWLNANLPIDPRKPLQAEDIAYIRLGPAQFAEIPGDAEYCAFRGCTSKRYSGLTVWLSASTPNHTSVAGLRGHIAYNCSGRTKPLFQYAKVKGASPEQ